MLQNSVFKRFNCIPVLLQSTGTLEELIYQRQHSKLELGYSVDVGDIDIQSTWEKVRRDVALMMANLRFKLSLT